MFLKKGCYDKPYNRSLNWNCKRFLYSKKETGSQKLTEKALVINTPNTNCESKYRLAFMY